MIKNLGKKKTEQLETIAFTIPAIILVSIMIYLPFIMSGYYSLTEWNGIDKKLDSQ
jgi:raffinose/stachyose/melibiose transport system permease protein